MDFSAKRRHDKVTSSTKIGRGVPCFTRLHKIFQKAYLTDMIQELVDIGIKVHCVIIERGWKEIDTVEDYKKALIDFKR